MSKRKFETDDIVRIPSSEHLFVVLGALPSGKNKRLLYVVDTMSTTTPYGFYYSYQLDKATDEEIMLWKLSN